MTAVENSVDLAALRLPKQDSDITAVVRAKQVSGGISPTGRRIAKGSRGSIEPYFPQVRDKQS